MMVDLEIDQYQDKMLDEDSVVGTDIKINPDFYIHMAIISCQRALSGDEPIKNMQKYWQAVEHLEALMVASKKLPIDYEDEINEFKKKVEYRQSSENRRLFLLNRHKYQVCIGVAFDMKPIDEPMRLR